MLGFKMYILKGKYFWVCGRGMERSRQLLMQN